MDEPVDDGNYSFIGRLGSLGTGNGQFNTTGYLAHDSLGDIYVSDFNNHRITRSLMLMGLSIRNGAHSEPSMASLLIHQVLQWIRPIMFT